MNRWCNQVPLHSLKNDIITVRDIVKELNLFGIPLDWKEHSFKDFLEFNGYKIVDDDNMDFEYSDCKAYLNLRVERN